MSGTLFETEWMLYFLCVTSANGGLKAHTSQAGKQLWRAPKNEKLRQNRHLALVD